MSFTVDKNGKKHYTMIAEPLRLGITFMGQSPEKKEEEDQSSSSEPSDPTDNSVTIVNPE